jgi:hypothetical protein
VHCYKAVIDTWHVTVLKAAKIVPSPVDRARPGWKHHVITEAHGIPLAGSLTGGQRNDVTQLMPRIAGRSARHPRGLPQPGLRHHLLAPPDKRLKGQIESYSPLGRGFLTGTIRSASQLGEGDVGTTMPRFADGNLQQNLRLVEGAEAAATEAGTTPARVAPDGYWPKGTSSSPRHIAPLEPCRRPPS